MSSERAAPAPGEQRDSGGSRVLREPLLHFLFLGAAIFLIAHAIEARRDAASARIVVDQRVVARIASLERAQSGIAPDAALLDRLVANYVDDELLYREALRLGLDRNDEIVRRRLIQKIEFLQHDVITDGAVDEVALRAYYDAHRARFTEPARISFAHLFFSPDRGGNAAAHARATRALASIAAGADPGAGDPPPVASSYRAITPADARQIFGTAEFAQWLGHRQPARWVGPVRSGYGWHLIRVSDRAAARAADFDSVRAEVRAEYLRDAGEVARRRQLEALRARYRVSLGARQPERAS
jgi:peptidyl-prolyl cis-trans isomerase C